MKKSIFYALLICCSALGSCSEQLEADVFGLSAHAADFTAEGGEKDIVMNTACDCELSCSDSWVTLSAQYIEAGKNTITVTAAPNPTFDSRQTVVSVFNDAFGVSSEIAVRQAGIVPSIDCDTTLDTTFEGGTFQIEVSSTIPWEASTDADWLTLSPAAGQAGVSILTVEIADLLSDTSRRGEIVLTNTEHKVTKKIKVNQNGLSQTEKARTITYTTDDNNPISTSDFDSAFDATIIAHIFDNETGMLIFDKPVTCIGYQAFYNCGNLKSITIPNSVTSIGNSAFYNSGLESITIPNSITAIGNSAFSSCRYLTSITIPDSVTEIGEGAFSNSSLNVFNGKFTSSDNKCLIVDGVLIAFAPMELIFGVPYKPGGSYTIPDNVTSIGKSAFYNSSLNSITIPNSVASIGDSAFSCTNLRSITIPDNVTSIGDYAFYNCSYLTSVIISNNITSISNYVFSDCNSLTSITIPDSVTSIGYNAFSNCSSLTNITIPDSVTSIGDYAFYNCSSLTSITIPNSVTSIGNYAFSYCSSLTSIIIGNSVTSIGNYAFFYCNNLANIYCKPTVPPSGGVDRFSIPSCVQNIYVPRTSVEAYKNDSGWKDCASIIVGYDF